MHCHRYHCHHHQSWSALWTHTLELACDGGEGEKCWEVKQTGSFCHEWFWLHMMSMMMWWWLGFHMMKIIHQASLPPVEVGSTMMLKVKLWSQSPPKLSPYSTSLLCLWYSRINCAKITKILTIHIIITTLISDQWSPINRIINIIDKYHHHHRIFCFSSYLIPRLKTWTCLRGSNWLGRRRRTAWSLLLIWERLRRLMRMTRKMSLRRCHRGMVDQARNLVLPKKRLSFLVTVCIVHLFERRSHPHYGKGSLQGPVTGSRRVPQAPD